MSIKQISKSDQKENIYNRIQRIAQYTEYLKNKLIDVKQESKVESTLEIMNSISEIFDLKIAEIKLTIVSALNS